MKSQAVLDLTIGPSQLFSSPFGPTSNPRYFPLAPMEKSDQIEMYSRISVLSSAWSENSAAARAREAWDFPEFLAAR